MKPTTIDDYHATLSPDDRAICDALREALDAALTGTEARMWHAHPVWFHDGNPIAGYGKLKSCIRLMFWSGQSFVAPGLTATGSFKAAEARYASADQIDHEAVQAWLAEALTVQWDYKNIVSRKGRLERLA